MTTIVRNLLFDYSQAYEGEFCIDVGTVIVYLFQSA